MMTTLLVALFVAIVGPLLEDEIKAWSCWLPQKLLRMAVAKLPEKYRERYDEEWASGIEEIPGELFKLFYSIGLLRAAAGISKAAPKNAVRQETTFASLTKRTIDITFACTVLIMLAPVLLTIAILIKLDSPGPIFYGSERVGKNGRIFRCLKFRTMFRDVEMMHMHERNSILLKISNYPRFTLLGRLLRKFSLDELPQIFNVLVGEMSLVGPRPSIVSEINEYKLSHPHCLDVAPGITGLWQIQVHQNPFLLDSNSLDETYLRNWSIWLDIKIILRTIWVAF
jgi:lipopolysaccharide/colanic/teichoic acid biosynthesis glycosyltransferase